MAQQNSTSTPANGNSAGKRLDPVLRDWIQIGSLAWSGHLAEGRGLVLATVTKGGVEYRYWAGSPCDCHAHWIDEYDPEKEAVVLVCRGEKESIYRIKATPAPPEAWARDISPRERRLPQ
jgi:hypothetical protein